MPMKRLQKKFLLLFLNFFVCNAIISGYCRDFMQNIQSVNACNEFFSQIQKWQTPHKEIDGELGIVEGELEQTAEHVFVCRIQKQSPVFHARLLVQHQFFRQNFSRKLKSCSFSNEKLKKIFFWVSWNENSEESLTKVEMGPLATGTTRSNWNDNGPSKNGENGVWKIELLKK